jgi:magnesium transporter
VPAERGELATAEVRRLEQTDDVETIERSQVAPSTSGPGGGARDERDSEAATLYIARATGRVVTESSSLADLASFVSEPDSIVWIDLTDPPAKLVAKVSRELGIHPLVVENIVDTEGRAKLETVDGALHMVLFAMTRDEAIRLHEIDFIIGRRFLLSTHPGTWDLRAAQGLRAGLGPVMSRGTDALLWALSDAIVDGYFPVFDQLADEIDGLEDHILEHPDHDALQRLLEMKRELIRIRHVVAPSREVLNQLTSREHELIREPQVLYFRDIYDHLVRLTDEFDSFRERTATTIELYVSTVNNNLTVIMKRLTAATVVLAGIAAVAGVFGMSEATSALDGRAGIGFWLVVLITVALAAVVLAVLRRIGWV